MLSTEALIFAARSVSVFVVVVGNVRGLRGLSMFANVHVLVKHNNAHLNPSLPS